MRPLDGITVLDLSRLLPGGAATLLFANFGAEVIKIEEPGTGDYGRSSPPFLHGEGAVFHLLNRGKKSVALALSYRARDRTLTDEEVNRAHAALVAEVTARLGVELRQ